MKEKSIYCNGNLVKPFKKLALYVLDFLSALILNLILFAFAELISNATPYIKDKKSNLQNTTNYLTAMIVDNDKDQLSKSFNIDVDKLPKSCKLQTLDERGYLADIDPQDLSGKSLVKEYIYSLVKISLDFENTTPVEDNLKYYENVRDDFDKPLNYYFKFRKENISEFKDEKDPISKQLNKDNYTTEDYCSFLNLKMDDECFKVEYYKGNQIIILNNVAKESDNSIAYCIDQYISYEPYVVGRRYYESIRNVYVSILKEAISDFEANYIPYKEKLNDYNNLSSSIYSSKNIENIICYILSLNVIYFLLPILLKNGRTLSTRIMKLAYVRKDNYLPNWTNLLIKYVINLVEYVLILPLTVLLFFNADAVDIIFTPLFLNVDLFSLAIFSLIILLLSFALTFILKKSKQSISELASQLVLKDDKVIQGESRIINMKEERQNQIDNTFIDLREEKSVQENK